MNAAQLPFLVEGIIMLMAGIFGILIGKAGKPYGKVKVVFHLFLCMAHHGLLFYLRGFIKGKDVNIDPGYYNWSGCADSTRYRYNDACFQEIRLDASQDSHHIGCLNDSFRHLCFDHTCFGLG